MNLESSGVTLERKTPDFIPSEARIRPLRDVIIVKPIGWQPSKIILISGSKRRPLRGTVVAAGPGTYHWQYNKDRSKRWLSKQFTPCDVKVGDIVELGSLPDETLGITGYAFSTILIGLEEHIICREADVCGVAE